MSENPWPTSGRLGSPSLHDSMDDFENSLDRAIKSATNNFFDYKPQSREGSQGSIAIPMSTLNPQGSAEHDDDNDSLPLMTGHDSTMLLPSSPTVASHSRGGLMRRALGLFRTIKEEVSREITDRSLVNNPDPESDLGSERYVSPRNSSKKFPSNAISNAKYNPITFIPLILYEQFKFFFNLYFLLVALSQIIPQLRIGYLSSYIVPLAFVLTVTMMKEAGDDIARRKRDSEQNNERYEVLNRQSPITQDVSMVQSKNLKVGDLVRLHKDRRIPADMILLQSSDANGEAFIKTDQLDGETDWKLRVACNLTDSVDDINTLINHVSLIVDKPTKSIHHFNGKLIYHQGSSNNKSVPLTIDQTLWANTVLASGTAIGIVIYTGVETRQLMNTTMSGVKTGLLELEINSLSKILCVTVFLLSVILVMAHGFPLKKTWYIDILRFLILFSTIIPVSLRVNLDLAKSVYASHIQKDQEIPNTIVRTSTIPEDLGRIEYLLSDKTGTLTQNDMEMKKLHLGSICYAGDTFDIVADYISKLLFQEDSGSFAAKRKDMTTKVCDLALVLALCHNVTPTEEDGQLSYQAASPDEIAIVRFCEQVGLRLFKRDRSNISLLHLATGKELKFEILYNFPFNSDTKRMGIIVKDIERDEITFMEKGADTVMANIVMTTDWLDEEISNMARDGLRTLVIGRKRLNAGLFQLFSKDYEEASLSMTSRDAQMQRVVSKYLETDVELLGITGVEDKLQKDVKTSTELLRNAGIKIWMLTGDKVETAKCVAISAKLIARGQYVHQITKVHIAETAMSLLDYLINNFNSCLLIDGESIAFYMKHFRREFMEIVLRLPAVIACRCTPQQKADIAMAIKEFTGRRVCCIGDGGNDVSMIQCADVGVGIVGKEGKQASLSADFSIDQFHFLLKLLLWHGRNSYKRSAKLGQFIIHRGLIISVAQAIYSISSKFEPLALYQGWLMVGYSTLYTMAPVFSLTLDRDIDERLTKMYPELYKELTLGKSLSYKTFFMWVVISLYQGSVIQVLSQMFQSLDTEKFLAMVTLSFGALILNELMMVGMTINTWNKTMVTTIVVTLLIYIGLIPFLTEYLDLDYITDFSYYWQTALVLAVSLFPVWLTQTVNRKLRPPTYAKVQQD